MSSSKRATMARLDTTHGVLLYNTVRQLLPRSSYHSRIILERTGDHILKQESVTQAEVNRSSYPGRCSLVEWYLRKWVIVRMRV